MSPSAPSGKGRGTIIKPSYFVKEPASRGITCFGLKVRELVRQTCEAFEIEILKGVVSKDHVHLLLSAPPNMAPSEIMRRIKGRSASKLFECYPQLKKRYWGRHFWARGYFCVTSGELTEEMIKSYLEHHFEAKVDDNFRTEG